MNDPILVNASPLAAQIAAGLRQFVLVLGAVLAMAGYGRWLPDDRVNMILSMVGPVSTILAIVLGQLATRSAAKKLAITAAAAPDEVAQVKT